MPGSGPPVPDLVLKLLKDGASFVPLTRAGLDGLGAISVNGVSYRLAITRSSSGAGAWRLDPDVGSVVSKGTFDALLAWAASASLDSPVQFDEGQLFKLALVDGLEVDEHGALTTAPIVRVLAAVEEPAPATSPILAR